MTSGWATPFVWDNGTRTEIVTIGRGFVISYDPDGQELWRLKGMTQATPQPGGRRRPALCRIRIAGRSEPAAVCRAPGRERRHLARARIRTRNEFVAWFQPRFSGYTPSPLVYRGRVYAVNDNGILQVADAKTGKEVYKARVGGGGHTFSSSPVASQGRIYLLSEDGDTFVLRAGDQYEEIAKNSLGEMSLATPAADADSLYDADADQAVSNPQAIASRKLSPDRRRPASREITSSPPAVASGTSLLPIRFGFRLRQRCEWQR